MIQNEEDKVWVTMVRTINLGNFNNIKYEVGYSKTIKKGEDPIKLIEEMEDELENNLSEKVNLIEDIDIKVDETIRRRKRR
jgi:divalent metal cation (Fe/Co/Zn/Cd) transporter